jgi:hypothetical protein
LAIDVWEEPRHESRKIERSIEDKNRQMKDESTAAIVRPPTVKQTRKSNE